jgi:putative copper resistance protein D
MSTLLVASRAVHFGSAILLFGELVFVLVVVRAWRHIGLAIPAPGGEQRFLLAASLGLAASVVSGATWLAAEAALMSGLPLGQALGRDTLELVFVKTAFGRLWILRFGLAVALAALLLSIARAKNHERKLRIAAGALVVAAAYLATLAWSGHAAAGQESDRDVQLFSDAIHLLAAGAWLGALPGLVVLLKYVEPPDAAARATRRFSALGILSVSALIVSGSTNAWYLVGDVPALFGTDYGRLLLAKLALVAAMIALALTNRLHLMPRLDAQQPKALHSLRRNALLETALGVLVVAIVGALGITVPAAHQSPVWPFAHTLSWQAAQESSSVRAALIAAIVLAGIGAIVIVTGARRRRAQLWIAGFILIGVATGAGGWLLAVPAYPTTYSISPVPYSVDAIVRGAALYGERCSACHGARGEGEGPLGSTLSMRPTNLAEHGSQHRRGDLFWWIAHGIAGTPMPGFGAQLRDAQIWELVQFLHARADAYEAQALTGRVDPDRAIVAPDFTFEIPGQAQQSLRAARGEWVTLLVFYTLPESLPRLRVLAAALPAFAWLRARVVAVPLGNAGDDELVKEGQSMFALASPNIAPAYAMFISEHAGASGAMPTHVELLIDRWGYIRARWIDVPAAAAKRTEQILPQIKRLEDEPPRVPGAERHAH